MKIEEILNKKNHKIYIFITYSKTFIQEWFGSDDKGIHDYGVLRIRYNRNPEDTDKFYFKERI